jgi:hypothetical protein
MVVVKRRMIVSICQTAARVSSFQSIRQSPLCFCFVIPLAAKTVDRWMDGRVVMIASDAVALTVLRQASVQLTVTNTIPITKAQPLIFGQDQDEFFSESTTTRTANAAAFSRSPAPITKKGR